MPHIRCKAIDCLHNDRADNNSACVIEEGCPVDISSTGRCIDYSPVTDDEYMMLNGGAGR